MAKNLVGPVVRKIRYQRGLTQAMLTARCNRAGWDIGENTDCEDRSADSLRHRQGKLCIWPKLLA